MQISEYYDDIQDSYSEKKLKWYDYLLYIAVLSLVISSIFIPLI